VIPAAAVTSYASSLAGQPVTIACNRDQSFKDDVLGYTLFDADTGYVYPVIYLPASTCKRLNDLAAPRRLLVADTRKGRAVAASARSAVDLPDGSAVDTLIHEATHILEQSTDEARVECDSYRNRWSAVKLFHLSATEDGQIMRGMSVAHFQSPADYLTDC
jgi:hypothetical protein